MNKFYFEECIPQTKGPSNKSGIIVIGGSSGGLRSKDLAEYFSAQGHPSAVIPYFDLEGLPN